ncbi:hypothetical protein [Paenibacillus contaminans]|uniref:Glycosyl hydrolase family 32 N-terminal domain-containing protein n=1 Tax=Paenibacillus contaminans TaxID=450362 RepID=A0A329MAB6_9BACL|nr:hypothetical protein [Paenibacillus contaminans]RAV16662.1 hypothetical protein DQG23_27880 [Paenibacillus contaminans]
MEQVVVKAGVTVLFLDMLEIESALNAKLTVNKAKKCKANPVLPLGDYSDWDRWRATDWAGSVIYDQDDKVFKMWYFGQDGPYGETSTGYATSLDGVWWEKPSLSIYSANSSRNNIVFSHYDHSGLRFSEHFCVIKDYSEKDERKRYKALARSLAKETIDGKTLRDFKVASNVVYSADGIHWTTSPHTVDGVDMTNILIDDSDPKKRFKVYGFVGTPERWSHTIMAYGPDMESLELRPDSPILPPEEESTVHLLCGLKYKGYYLAFYNYSLWTDYYGYTGVQESRRFDTRVPKDVRPGEGWGAFKANTRLAVSRDGVNNFVKVNPLEAILDRGEKGEWDDAFIVTSNPVVKDDEIYVFYSGTCEPAANAPQRYDTSQVRSGVAKIERGRLTYLSSADQLSTAVITTVPMEIAKSSNVELRINAGELIPYRDYIEVEAIDAETNEPIAGFERRDCLDLYSDGFDIPAIWNGSSSLDDLRDRNRIKLRFYLYGKARLYSFSFAERAVGHGNQL